jgi:hypothetical protein
VNVSGASVPDAGKTAEANLQAARDALFCNKAQVNKNSVTSDRIQQ